MHQLLTPPLEVRTDRLVLAPVTPADLDDLVALFPRRVDAEHAVQDAIGSRVRHGLGPWTARTIERGELVAFGGAVMRDRSGWLFDVRVVPDQSGRGLDAELLGAAHREVDRLATRSR